jgi:RNA polymerase-binding transcription factor DksA
MTKNEIEMCRNQLLKLERGFQGDVDILANESFHKTDGKAIDNLSNISVEERAKLGSDTCGQEAKIDLLENESVRLGEINAALERIDRGTFGRCEACGQEISISLLQAAPFVRQCVDCARKSQ